MRIHGSAWIVIGIPLRQFQRGMTNYLCPYGYGDIHSRRIAAQSLINIGDVERHLANPFRYGNAAGST